jgi:Tfp pilus assembly protein PilF
MDYGSGRTIIFRPSRLLCSSDTYIAEYQTAIQLDPKDALPHNNLGNIYIEQGKPEMAIVELKTAIHMTRNFRRYAQKASDGCNKAECRL